MEPVQQKLAQLGNCAPHDGFFSFDTSWTQTFSREDYPLRRTVLSAQGWTDTPIDVAEIHWTAIPDIYDPEVLVLLDARDVEGQMYWPFLEWAQDADDIDPFETSTMIVNSVHVGMNWRGLGLAKYMLKAVPTLMADEYPLVVAWPWRSPGQPNAAEETKRLRTLTRRAGWRRWKARKNPFGLYTFDNRRSGLAEECEREIHQL